MTDCHAPLHPEARRGLELIRRGEYFEAHEALENAWRDEPGQVRNLYRGILQMAVSYLHITRANYAGAVEMHRRAGRWLAGWPALCRGIEVDTLRRDFDAAIAALTALGPENMHQFDRRLLKPVRWHGRAGKYPQALY